MSYSFYLDKIRLPVAPPRLDIKSGGKLRRFDLLSGGEIVTSGGNGLCEISFTASLPLAKYPFASYPDGFEKGNLILDKIVKLKEQNKPFRFIVTRKSADKKTLFSTNLKVVFDELRIIEDAGDGGDISVAVRLMEYRDFSVKKVKTTGDTDLTDELKKSDEHLPDVSVYTVVKGDCLWLLAQRFLGSGALYRQLYEMNKEIIDGKNKGTGNPIHTIYPGQVLRVSK